MGVRRHCLIIVGCLIVLSAMPACRWLPDKPVAIAAYVWPGYEPMFLARGEGWLDVRRVRLVETALGSESLKALAEGRGDGAALTLDEVLKSRGKGMPLSVVMIFDVSSGADMLVARSGIKKLADLQGQRIGFEQGTVGELVLAEVLRAAGLRKEDVIPLPLPVDQQRSTWARGRVDAVVTYEPVVSQLLAQGARKLFDSRQIPNTIVDVRAIRSDVLDRRHASAIRHLLVAHFRG